MNTTNDRAKVLANKWLNKVITPEEKQEFNAWYRENLDETVNIPEGFVGSEEEHRLRILNAIQEATGSRPVVKLWPRIRAAVGVAAAVAMVVFGLWFFNSRPTETSSTLAPALTMNDIAPGKNGATITLANGKVIQLSDAKTGVVIGEDLKYSDGEILRDALNDKKKDDTQTSLAQAGQILTANTNKGQTYEFILPDGTQVQLNAASSLKFPSKFDGQERIVELKGEAYFQVAKDKKHKFKVRSAGQELTVLGTHFNVNAYEDESGVKTTLLEGSVRVNDTETSSAPAVILKPNQQSIVTGSNRIKIEEVNAEDAIAWKNGVFLFEDEPLQVIMRKVSRWYNVDIEYQDVDKDKRYFGGVSRSDHVSKVLRKLELTGGVHFKIEGRRVIVMK
jgi:ferric-dicitrate binding protein FerR (iron transport regulator)